MFSSFSELPLGSMEWMDSLLSNMWRGNSVFKQADWERTRTWRKHLSWRENQIPALQQTFLPRYDLIKSENIFRVSFSPSVFRVDGVPSGPVWKNPCCLSSVNCLWGQWGGWTACSVTCGGGTQFSSRVMEKEAEHGGSICDRETTRYQPCSTNSCLSMT